VLIAESFFFFSQYFFWETCHSILQNGNGREKKGFAEIFSEQSLFGIQKAISE